MVFKSKVIPNDCDCYVLQDSDNPVEKTMICVAAHRLVSLVNPSLKTKSKKKKKKVHD